MSMQLDADEYFHLALHASATGQHHTCMTYLKEVLQKQPRHAMATYLLAVQHAELGLVARSIEGMRAALAIDPRIEVARFQLGWMLVNVNRVAEARECFAALSGSTDEMMRLFAEGMTALVDNNTTLAREQLARGLAAPSGNPALMTLVRQLLERLWAQPAAAPAAEVKTTAHEPVFLGAYGQKTP
jgi:Tfp pilus assembly protein PilF